MLNKKIKVYLDLTTSFIFVCFLQLFSKPQLFLLLCLFLLCVTRERNMLLQEDS